LTAPHLSPPPIIGEPPFQGLFPPSGDTRRICGVGAQGVENASAVEELLVLEGHKTVASGHYPEGLKIHDDPHRRAPLDKSFDIPAAPCRRRCRRYLYVKKRQASASCRLNSRTDWGLSGNGAPRKLDERPYKVDKG